MAELLRGELTTPQMGAPTQTADEATAKEALRFGGVTETQAATNSLGLFGLTLVTCERGDLRESPHGLYLYRRGARSHIAVDDELRGAAELAELYHAVRRGRALVHDGRWGAATLEVCLAIHASAGSRSEILLNT
jgi:hypothetical protein